MPDTAIVYVHALTALHPGSGTALGVVDLPVQRERHTGWPIIAGSSMKGVLREACRPRDGKGSDTWLAAFGPETGDAHEHAGAISITDARLLAFPVRSLKGVFAWVTCPSALARYQRDRVLLGAATAVPMASPSPRPGQALWPRESSLAVTPERIVLEEFEFSRGGDGTEIAGSLVNGAALDDGTADLMRERLCVLHDDDFTHFVRHATEVVARIGLDYEHKTVKKGALFYEEYLPAETLLYSVPLATRSRRGGVEMSPGDVLEYLCSSAPGMLQIGAGETTGKGFCAVGFARSGEEGGT